MVDVANLLVGLLVQKLDALLIGEKKLGLLYKLDEGEDAGAHWYFSPHDFQAFCCPAHSFEVCPTPATYLCSSPR